MVCIQNYSTYNSGMEKSIGDKLFFLKHTEDANSILDFGCASGDVLKQIKRISPSKNLYGYDIDKNMVEIAKKNCFGFAGIYDEFEKIKDCIDTQNTILNLSSVIHEVYSYGNKDDVDTFWERVFLSGFKYIAIRDMCMSKNCNRLASADDYKRIRRFANLKQLSEHVDIWGDVDGNKSMIHYLMKYRYLENWDREVRENYFPIYEEDLISKIPSDKYKIIYHDHYILPFTKEKVIDDFGIEIKDNTHLKLILKMI